MYRFVAFLQRSVNPDGFGIPKTLIEQIRSAADDWSVAFDSPRLLVLHTSGSSRQYRVYHTRGDGILLGTLFSHTDPPSRVGGSLDISDPRSLSSRYWGRYVGFISTVTGNYCVFRDPTAALPCYYVETDGLVAIFSHIEDYRRVAARGLTVNWHFLNVFLTWHRVISPETGFQEIHQILGGECVEFRQTGSERSLFWNPNSFASQNTFERVDEAAAALARVTENCVRAWSSCYGSILHQLSGGFDSAVVLGCMATHSKASNVVCMNMALEAVEGDERIFARLAADRAGCQLVEVPQNPFAKRIADMLVGADFATPKLAVFQTNAEDFRDLILQQRGFDAVFTGQGGDHLFQRRRDSLVASEYLHSHGFGSEFAQRVVENAQMSGHSVWSVLAASLRHGLLGSPFDPFDDSSIQTSLLSRTARRSVSKQDLRHPWFDRNVTLPASKLKHLYDVLDCQAFYLYECRHADLVHPLISQPIIEICLQIPTYVLCDGGIDRGLARKAFAAKIPREIAERISKGGFNSFWHDMIMWDAQYVREFLRTGNLARHNVLDSKALETAMTESTILGGRYLHGLVTALLAEAWLQQSARSAPSQRAPEAFEPSSRPTKHMIRSKASSTLAGLK